MPAEFGVHFLPCMKNVPKRTKMHLNEVGITNNERTSHGLYGGLPTKAARLKL